MRHLSAAIRRCCNIETSNGARRGHSLVLRPAALACAAILLPLGCSHREAKVVKVDGHVSLYTYVDNPPAGSWPNGTTMLIDNGVAKRLPAAFVALARNNPNATLSMKSAGVDLSGRPNVRWTYAKKPIALNLNCYAGVAPQVALSSDGLLAACVQFDKNTQGEDVYHAYIIDFSGLPNIKTKLLTQDIQIGGNASVAFAGAATLAFLRYDPKCAFKGPMLTPTRAMLYSLRTNSVTPLSCAEDVIPTNNGVALSGFTPAGTPRYSVDLGRHWTNGFLVGVADETPVFLEDNDKLAESSAVVWPSDVLIMQWAR